MALLAAQIGPGNGRERLRGLSASTRTGTVIEGNNGVQRDGFRILFAALLALSAQVWCDEPQTDVFSDTWEAVDNLGRRLPTHAEAGDPRDGKYVGIFYFLWLGAHGQSGPHDITRILKKNSNAMQEPDNAAWGPMHAFHHWGEPLFGYYLSDDAYVLKQHARMLADAGADVVIFDVTNQTTYKDNYLALCKAFTEVRAAGSRTPQIAFLCPFGDPANVVRELHRDLYGPGLYPELWFQWEGKPLILADPTRVDDALRAFFTFRKPVPSYFTGPDGPGQWGWLEVFPQHIFRNAGGEAEQMTVGVAQNAVGDRLASMSEPGARGRSFHDGAADQKPDAVLYGYNFEEQWRRVFEIDPEFVFITGWNEWVAMRLNEFNGVQAPVIFVDEFDQEHSRDIEPMRGGHGDNYYYQMIANIRRFKGVRPQPAAGPPKTIAIDGDFGDWQDVTPEYRDHTGDPVFRDHPGWGTASRFLNRSGRNDFAVLKVARDAENLYFYARTRNYISLRVEPHWMMLFLDTDRDHETGWEGFDFVLNRVTPPTHACILERAGGDFACAPAGQAAYAVKEKELELAIPRAALGLTADTPLDIEFKWADNIMREGNIAEFTVNGDAAPPGRFNYRYFE